jgi:hypothetical protein
VSAPAIFTAAEAVGTVDAMKISPTNQIVVFDFIRKTVSVKTIHGRGPGTPPKPRPS